MADPKFKHFPRMCRTPGCFVRHAEPDSGLCGYCRVKAGLPGINEYKTANAMPDYVGFDLGPRVHRVAG